MVKKVHGRTRPTFKAALAAVAAMGLFIAASGNAFAGQAKSSSASAFGLEATGLLPIGKTPTASAIAPPDGAQENRTTLKVPAAALAVEALLVAKAEAHFNDGTNPIIVPPGRSGTNRSFRPVGTTSVNTRAYASADNLRVLVNAPGVDCNATPESPLCVSAVSADAVEAEAVAKCVNNQPVFDTGFNRLGLTALGINVSGLVNPILDPILALLGPGAALSAVAKVEEGVVDPIMEGGQQVGVSIDALRISVLGTAEVITVAHAEARMPRECSPPVAAASPGPKLAQTGGGGLSSLIGASLVMGAVLMMIFVRKFSLR